ncbi:superfamily II DNA or RNA helicase [Kineothrix alysoides]|uniref:Superfamily II DNA or RNA helicase n=1 Tax=Kineothrix alysoides TaxID=1469948 RepID=A0A4R1R0T0_9FIRM|nr:DEAD/DEAH box helicase family protein [Kineothrix alysoides]TCL58896.1 superfamily II DNA or RNA helicase [Kineothrix alysoides]
MICIDNFRNLTKEEEKDYPFKICEQCCFCKECELINDHMVSLIQACTLCLDETAKSLRSTVHLPVHIRDVWEDGICPMKKFNQIACGDQWVAKGIGDDFKADIKYDYKKEQFKVIQSSDKKNCVTDKWEPNQPIIISAPTGGGKNTFIEHESFEYVRKLNHQNKTEYKILLLSNRRALTEQTKNRIKKGEAKEDKINFDYREYINVMSYQSLLNQVEHLKNVQACSRSKYLFVVCDEAHFFTSDASFNPDTEKILEAIVDIFQDAIRIYMTATPYECLKYIEEKESRNDKYIPGILYHFKRDYSYLDAKYFSDENTELKDIIKKSVINKNERWLVFIDSRKQGAAFKKLLEKDDKISSLKGRVITIDADSKYNDEKYQEMIVSECFGKDINVVIATSVIDNGVNFRNIQNVVITDTDRTKCLQMVGRIRIEKDLVTKSPCSKVTMYIKRHDEIFISRRLNAIGIQQDAYHDYDMAAESKNYKWQFFNKYKDNDLEDWKNSKHWFGRDKMEPDRLYQNKIARSLADKRERIYKSILEEMEETGKENMVTGQRYLEFQLSWFGKEYIQENDITLSGQKHDGQIEFEQWIKEEWGNKKITKEEHKNFGKEFFERYHPIFGICTKKQGFSSDDNRGENGPKTAGYSLKRINEIFQVMNMPFRINEEDGYCTISMV